MSIFGKIRDAIFGHRAQAAPTAPAQQSQAAPAQVQAMPQMNAQPTAAPQAPVDVDAVLADMAAKNGQQLNYKSSIVDLMKLLGLDSSLANREQLAGELGYAGPKDGSAEMNVALHKAVMQKLVENGGKVSADLKG